MTDPDKPARDLVAVLSENGHIESHQVTALLAEEFGMAMVGPGAIKPTEEALKTMPRSLAVRYHAFPISRDGSTLKVAIADPLDMDGVDSLSHVLQLSIEPCIALREQIDNAI